MALDESRFGTFFRFEALDANFTVDEYGVITRVKPTTKRFRIWERLCPHELESEGRLRSSPGVPHQEWYEGQVEGSERRDIGLVQG